MPVVKVFHSVRALKRLLRKMPLRRRLRHRVARRCRSGHSKGSMRIRELVAPKLAGRYAMALLMRRTLDDEVSEAINDTLRDLIPYRFKLAMEPDRVTIRRIYLKDERDLFAVVLAFGDKVWRIKRIVRVRSPARPQTETGPADAATAQAALHARAVRLFGRCNAV